MVEKRQDGVIAHQHLDLVGRAMLHRPCRIAFALSSAEWNLRPYPHTTGSPGEPTQDSYSLLRWQKRHKNWWKAIDGLTPSLS